LRSIPVLILIRIHGNLSFFASKNSKRKKNLLSLYRQGLIHYLSEALNAGIEKDFADHQRGDKALAYLYAGAVYNLEVYYLSLGGKESPADLTEEFLRFLRYDPQKTGTATSLK